MGASYSSSQVTPSISLSDVTSTEDTTNELQESTEPIQEQSVNKEIFVLFEDDRPVCYSNKFNTLFEKAITIKNKIIYNLITNHGNTFTASTKENTDNKSFCNVTILTRETNCLNSHHNIYKTLSIISLNHLDDIENIEDEIVNRTNSTENDDENNDEEINEEVEPSNPQQETESADENLYNSDNEDDHHFNEHNDSNDSNEDNENKDNNLEENLTKTTKVE